MTWSALSVLAQGSARCEASAVGALRRVCKFGKRLPHRPIAPSPCPTGHRRPWDVPISQKSNWDWNRILCNILKWLKLAKDSHNSTPNSQISKCYSKLTPFHLVFIVRSSCFHLVLILRSSRIHLAFILWTCCEHVFHLVCILCASRVHLVFISCSYCVHLVFISRSSRVHIEFI